MFTPVMLRRYLAEFLGTFAYVFFWLRGQNRGWEPDEYHRSALYLPDLWFDNLRNGLCCQPYFSRAV